MLSVCALYGNSNNNADDFCSAAVLLLFTERVRTCVCISWCCSSPNFRALRDSVCCHLLLFICAASSCAASVVALLLPLLAAGLLMLLLKQKVARSTPLCSSSALLLYCRQRWAAAGHHSKLFGTPKRPNACAVIAVSLAKVAPCLAVG